MSYFSSDYSSARKMFLDAVNAIPARMVTSHLNPVEGVDGLYTDIVTCGPEDAENALVLISGTHGVEGFAGSAIQTGLLCEGLVERLPERTRLVMVHALNPFGFACLRRFNEDNVDLNRNFVDHDAPYPENPDYDRLAELVAPQSLSLVDNVLAMMKISWLRVTRGHEAMQQAVTYGQYNHPDGLFYGGIKVSWSNEILHEVIRSTLAGRKSVIAIDFHTGLGPYGQGEIILNDPVEDPAYQRASSWWGKERVKSTVRGESVSSHLAGTLKLAFDRALPDAEVTGVGLEFGTVTPMQVFKALRAENWLHHRGGKDHPDAARIKARLLQVFCPDDEAWRQNVWKQGREVVEKALASFEQ